MVWQKVSRLGLLKQRIGMLWVFIQGFVCAFDRYRLSPTEESVLLAFFPVS